MELLQASYPTELNEQAYSENPKISARNIGRTIVLARMGNQKMLCK